MMNQPLKLKTLDVLISDRHSNLHHGIRGSGKNLLKSEGKKLCWANQMKFLDISTRQVNSP